MNDRGNIVPSKADLATAEAVIMAWANATTDASSRRRADLLRDKRRVLVDFFEYVGKPLNQVTPMEVKAWQADLEERGLVPSTIYTMVSRVSSFYNWARGDPELTKQLKSNPVGLARLKAPKPFKSESTKRQGDLMNDG